MGEQTKLLELLKQGARWQDRASAAKALGELRDKAAVEALIEAMEGDEDHTVRNEAATALGLIGDKRAIEPLRRALKDPEYIVQFMAQQALAKLERGYGNSTLRSTRKMGHPRLHTQSINRTVLGLTLTVA